MSRAALAALAVAVLGGCPGAPSRPPSTAQDKPSRDDETRLTRAYNELEDDILTSYDRDEPPEFASGVIDARIGGARIGVGPKDLYVTGDRGPLPARWPIEVDRSVRTEVRSKRLAIQLSQDLTAGWMSDELSWRVELCGRTAVVPLRMTALYARDGDRWVLVFEHLSFGFHPTVGDAPASAPLRTEVASGDLRDELSGVLARSLFRVPHDPAVAAQTGGALVLGPDIADEWHDARVLEAQLPPGTLEDRRVGVVGRDPETATIAYWVGNYVASIPTPPGAAGADGASAAAAGTSGASGKVRMRVTHVFEKRWFASPAGLPTDGKSCGLPANQRPDASWREGVAEHCRWMLVQSHLSQPISDDELTRQVFGSARITTAPLRLRCPDAPGPTVPAAGPRRASDLGATRTR